MSQILKTKVIKINGHSIELYIHYIDNEVSEVYASIDGIENEFAYDIESMFEKLNNNNLLK